MRDNTRTYPHNMRPSSDSEPRAHQDRHACTHARRANSEKRHFHTNPWCSRARACVRFLHAVLRFAHKCAPTSPGPAALRTPPPRAHLEGMNRTELYTLSARYRYIIWIVCVCVSMGEFMCAFRCCGRVGKLHAMCDRENARANVTHARPVTTTTTREREICSFVWNTYM